MESKTKFEIRPSAFNPQVMVLKVDGFIDVNAVPEFEKVLEHLIQSRRYALLIDFADVPYISSAGVGVIVGSLQTFRDHYDGDIKLFQVSPKIMNVFRSIGLEDMADVVEKEEQVSLWKPRQLVADFEYFTFTMPDTHILCGREFSARIEVRDRDHQIVAGYQGEPQAGVSDGLIFPRELTGFKEGVWEGKFVTTGTGIIQLTLEDSGKSSAFDLAVEEKEQRANFPCQITCSCGMNALVRGTEIYRCQRCDEIFYVDPWAHVIMLKSGSTLAQKIIAYKGAEIKINSDINYLTSLRRFITGLCEQENISELMINDIVLATEEAILNIIEHGYNFNPDRLIDIRIKIQPRKAEVKIRDQGKAYDITQKKNVSLKSIVSRGKKGGLGTVLINQLMDKIKYQSAQRYNQLVMVKYLKRKLDRTPAAVKAP